MSAKPLRHYYVAGTHPNADDRCRRHDCARAKRDPVHLEPGDDAAWDAAVKASTAGHNPHHADPAYRERAAKRHAARWTYGTGNAPTGARGPSASG